MRAAEGVFAIASSFEQFGASDVAAGIGRDFAAFPTSDSDILIGCQGGNVVQDYLCPHGCKSNGTAATCFP